MGRIRRRPALAAVAVLVAAAAFAAAQGEEKLEEEFTSCWPCHVAWPQAPLRSLYDIRVPDEQGGAETFDYTVQVHNPWLHDILFLEPSLDLSQAPSLRFFDGREPVELEELGTIEVDPAGLLDPEAQELRPQRGHVVIGIPPGATDMTLILNPYGATVPPDLVLRAYPGSQQPNGTPAVVRDEAGPGEPETFTTDASAEEGFQHLGTGNWTIEAELKVEPATGGVFAGDVEFHVAAMVEFNANEEDVQFLSRQVEIKPDQSELVTWRLQPVGIPGPDEHATLQVDAMVFWEHEPSSQADDFANVTKEMRLDVVEMDGGAALVADPDAVGVDPGPATVGVSMASVSEALGYAAAFLLVASVYSGGMFGKASRRQLNKAFGAARRRVAFHNVLSYGIILASVVHLVLFIVETKYHWTLGLIWGGVAMLAMLGLGLTGALQVPMIRRWNYGLWRWSHLGLAIAALVFTAVHLLLDGAHFGEVQDFVGWYDPLDNRGLLNPDGN